MKAPHIHGQPVRAYGCTVQHTRRPSRTTTPATGPAIMPSHTHRHERTVHSCVTQCRHSSDHPGSSQKIAAAPAVARRLPTRGIAHARNKCPPPVVKHLRRGCLAVEADPERRLTRHKVTSRAIKGENTPAGVEATWVVGAPVADAIRVLEQLQPDGQDWLFAPLVTGHHHNRRRDGRTHNNEVLSIKATIEDISGLIAWINRYCAERNLPDRVPDIHGQPARVTTAQFRRTLAWFIARRPGGSIAGAIAYRHHSVHMFEGYAGTSASGFRAEVEAEQHSPAAKTSRSWSNDTSTNTWPVPQPTKPARGWASTTGSSGSRASSPATADSSPS